MNKVELECLEQQAKERFSRKLIARDFFPVKRTENVGDVSEHLIPVISKTFSFDPTKDFDFDAFFEVVDEVSSTEDKLMLSGEHTGWAALGIQGLSTKEGRTTFIASGIWPNTVFDDIANARKHLRDALGQHITPILIASHRVFEALERIAWSPPEDRPELEPKTHLNILLDQKLIRGAYASNNLLTAAGGDDSALIYHPTSENYILSSHDLSFHSWDGDNESQIVVRECVVPVIKKPKTIVEIQHVF